MLHSSENKKHGSDCHSEEPQVTRNLLFLKVCAIALLYKILRALRSSSVPSVLNLLTSLVFSLRPLRLLCVLCVKSFDLALPPRHENL